MKLISVIMGIKYTRAETDTLKRSIDSILNQTYENIELLICEKGSSEDAKAILCEYRDKSDKIKLIDGSGAKSFSEQLNMCLAVASGDFIARMDDDDYSLPERFQKQVDFLEENTDFAFVGSNVSLFWQGEIFDTDTFPEKPEVRDFLYVMPFVHPSIMFRREVFDKVGF
jgi:glycosyltransferase involved in cell wall biosynthesis